MSNTEPTIRINVDVTNPGQFLACCGLLELADRLWPGAEGWFEVANRVFCLHTPLVGATDEDSRKLLASLTTCDVTNTMTGSQVRRRCELASLSKKELQEQQLEDEKKALARLWREEPIVFHSPFDLQVNWFLDDYSGGSRFKTWAGQQSVLDITRAMKESIAGGGDWGNTDCAYWLGKSLNNNSVPFNFDSNLGPQSSSLDVGYSLDALKVSTRTRPLIELGAFIGLQRFRPLQVDGENLYRYRTWQQPLDVRTASIAACTLLSLIDAVDFEFRLLYRTKYLKSFLPATLVGVTL